MSVLALLLSLSASGAEMPEAYRGTWSATGGNRQAAIDELVSDMPIFKRPFARTRLNRVTRPCAQLVFYTEGAQLAIRCDDRPPAIDLPDGEPVEYVDASGNTHQLSIELRDGNVVQSFRSDQVVRTNVYKVGGGRMNMEVTVQSDRLPRDLVYLRTFERTGRGPST